MTIPINETRILELILQAQDQIDFLWRYKAVAINDGYLAENLNRDFFQVVNLRLVVKYHPVISENQVVQMFGEFKRLYRLEKEMAKRYDEFLKNSKIDVVAEVVYLESKRFNMEDFKYINLNQPEGEEILGFKNNLTEIQVIEWIKYKIANPETSKQMQEKKLSVEELNFANYLYQMKVEEKLGQVHKQMQKEIAMEQETKEKELKEKDVNETTTIQLAQNGELKKGGGILKSGGVLNGLINHMKKNWDSKSRIQKLVILDRINEVKKVMKESDKEFDEYLDSIIYKEIANFN